MAVIKLGTKWKTPRRMALASKSRNHGQRPDRGVVGEEHVGRPAGDGPLGFLGRDHFLLEPSPPAGVELPVPPVDGEGPTQSEEADALLGVRAAI